MISRLQNDNTGSTIVAKVADECPSCGGYGNVDLSTGAFSALANMNDGVFPLTWWCVHALVCAAHSAGSTKRIALSSSSFFALYIPSLLDARCEPKVNCLLQYTGHVWTAG